VEEFRLGSWKKGKKSASMNWVGWFKEKSKGFPVLKTCASEKKVRRGGGGGLREEKK